MTGHGSRPAPGQLPRQHEEARRAEEVAASSGTTTSAPRKCTQPGVVARLIGASGGPKKPWTIISTPTSGSGICKSVRV